MTLSDNWHLQTKHVEIKLDEAPRIAANIAQAVAFEKDLMSAPCCNSVVLRERTVMIAPLTSGKCQLNGRSIALAVTLAILMSIAPHEASARGGPLHLLDAWAVSQAQAATGASRNNPTTETLGVGCGGKRYRDPITHRCRGPADFGN
jgi:hypothetical protein